MRESTSPKLRADRSRTCRTCSMWLQDRISQRISNRRRKHLSLEANNANFLSSLCGVSHSTLRFRALTVENARKSAAADRFDSNHRLIHYAAMETWKSG